jgi:heme exporter protein B
MISREIRILILHKGALLNALSFFILCLFSMTLAIRPNVQFISETTPALIWILVMLTTFFSTPTFIRQEAQEGLLDEILLQPSPPALTLIAKVIAETLCLGLPLILISLLVSERTFSLSLLISYPALSALSLWGSLLTVRSSGGGILLSLLILPLALPLLLFSLSATETARLGLDSFPSFCLLTSVSLLLFILGIAAGSKALRLAVEG